MTEGGKKHFVETEKMPLLLEVTRKLYLSLNIRNVVRQVLHLAMQLVDADGGSVMLVDRKSKKLSIENAVKLQEQYEKATSLGMGERVAGWVAQNKIPLILHGRLQENPQFSALEGREDVHSSLCLPLKVNDTVVGVLNLNRMVGGEMPDFAQSDLRVAVTFARYGAAALQNARLCETLMNRNKLLAEQSKSRTLRLAEFCHEINIPVTAINNYITNALDGDLGKLTKEATEALRRVKEQLSKVLVCLGDLRSASTRELELGEADVGELVSDAIRSVEVWTKEKTLTVETEIPEELPRIYVDKARIEQVFVNLLRNAIKFSEESGKIGVSAQPQESEMLFCVSDSGRGIAPEAVEMIFESFYQAEDELEVPGQGLGLAISKRIVETHGGSIWAESESERGSKFFFTLPLAGRQDPSS